MTTATNGAPTQGAPNAGNDAPAPAPKPGSPEYMQAMAAKFRASQSTTNVEGGEQAPQQPEQKPAPKQRPENVPEKFWNAETGEVNVEALLKSYGELEKGRGQKKPERPQIAEQPAEGEQDGDAKGAVEAAGLNWDTLKGKITSSGKLDESDYAALEKTGIPKAIVDEYISLATKHIESETLASIEYAGGEEAAAALMKWAGENLSDQEKQTYNAMLSSQNWRTAIDVLKTKMEKSRPAAGEPKLKTPGVVMPAGGSNVGYSSQDEMKADMANPQYKVNAAFRAQVAQKIKFAAWRR